MKGREIKGVIMMNQIEDEIRRTQKAIEDYKILKTATENKINQAINEINSLNMTLRECEGMIDELEDKLNVLLKKQNGD